jgi:site-specific recombinase
LRVTENAGKTGEHYVANDRTEYRAMLASAMGAGLVVAVMALVPRALSRRHRRRVALRSRTHLGLL